MENNEKRFARSSIKLTTNLVLVLVVIVALLLFNFFVLDDLGGNGKDAKWWIYKALTGLGTFLVMIGLANSTEESLKIRNKTFVDKCDALDDHYAKVLKNGEGDYIDLYLLNVNKRSKYNAYIKQQKRKLHLAKKFIPYAKRKDSKRLLHLEKTLIVNSEDVWAMEKRIRYPKLTFQKLVSGAYNITEREMDDNDVSIHRADAVITKLIWKMLIIVGLGMFVPDLAYHFQDWSKDMLLPLLLRIATILWAMYSGVAFGYYMNDRVLVALRKKLKKFSEFRTRTDNEQYKTLSVEQRYSVAIVEDAMIIKLKTKHKVAIEEPHKNGIDVVVPDEKKEEKQEPTSTNPIVKTIQEIDHPISMGTLGGNLINNIIKEGAKNDT